MSDPTAPEFLTVSEAAELLRLPERTVARMLNAGLLPGIFAGRREGWRIRRSELLRWTTNRPSAEYMRLPTPEEAEELKKQKKQKRPAKHPPKNPKQTED